MSTQTWNIDHAHSAVEFSVRHMVFAKVRGRFATWRGSVELDDDFSSGHVHIEIDANSIDTGNTDRDAHLRSADFFDAERHPALVFRSKSVRPQGEREFVLDGELTIRGATRPVSLTVEHTGSGTDPWGQFRVGFNGEAVINRREFGLTWNQALETGGVLVGENVSIAFEVQLVRAAAQKAA